MNVTYTRLYATSDGESHWEHVGAELSPTNFAPPAPPLHVSDPVGAASVRFMAAPLGWVGEPHPSPRRQIFVVLSGCLQRVWNDNHAVYGADKVWHQLGREKVDLARCTVERLMRDMGISGAARDRAFKVTTRADENAFRPPDSCIAS